MGRANGGGHQKNGQGEIEQPDAACMYGGINMQWTDREDGGFELAKSGGEKWIQDVPPQTSGGRMKQGETFSMVQLCWAAFQADGQKWTQVGPALTLGRRLKRG